MAENDREKAHPLAKVAIALGLLSTLLGIFSTGLTLFRTTSIGKVEAIQPLSGYALIRGIDPTYEGEPDAKEGLGLGPFPPDHLVLPLQWNNNTGTTVLLKQPTLELRELGPDGSPSGEKIEFFFVGHLPELSAGAFMEVNEKPHDFSTSIVLNPHTITQSVMVFRPKDWLDENRCLRFHQGQEYQVDLGYDRIPQDPRVLLPGAERSTVQQLEFGPVKSLPILDTANWLSPYGKDALGWDYVSLLPGSRAEDAQNLPENGTPQYEELEECS